ncbi:MAG: 2OG-Fe(II) oxygenase family protein [Hyphomonadaceae bacterium]
MSQTQTLSARPLALAPNPGEAAAADEYARTGLIQLHDFLEPASADTSLNILRNETRWRTIYNDGALTHEVDEEEFNRDPNARMRITRDVFSRAKYDFQYIFDQFPVFVMNEEGKPLSAAHQSILDFFNGEIFLDAMRRITRDDRITFADVFLSRYRPGHFLTSHDDKMDGTERLHAYVFNLTHNWKMDWGGMLLFIDDNTGNVPIGLRPTFNTLNLFKVPRSHTVSLVAPFAPEARYAVTGWLRAS